MTGHHCPTEQELSAYFDSELGPARSAEVAAHLPECGACRAELARLQRVSDLFRVTSNQRLSQISRARLVGAIKQNNEAGILRLAWTLSGLAASVLVVGSLWLTQIGDRSDAQALSAPPPWVGLSDTPDANLAQRESTTPAAAWYLASNNGDEQP